MSNTPAGRLLVRLGTQLGYSGDQMAGLILRVVVDEERPTIDALRSWIEDHGWDEATVCPALVELLIETFRSGSEPGTIAGDTHERATKKNRIHREEDESIVSNTSGVKPAEYYVQYLDHIPIKINTHFHDKGERDMPLDSISELLDLFIPSAFSELVENYSLHHQVDGLDVVYNPSDSLTVLGTNGTDASHPLIVRESITRQACMELLPPPVEYGRRIPRFNCSGSTWPFPGRLRKWVGFIPAVSDWVPEQLTDPPLRVAKPSVVGRIVSDEVQGLQPFLFDNILKRSASCCIPVAEFGGLHDAAHSVGGKPDFLMMRNGKVVAVIEVKGKWTLSSASLVDDDGRLLTTSTAVSQLYEYMMVDSCQHAILTTYEHTWFLYRSAHDGVNGEETLFISEGVPYDSVNPTVVQCICYFNTLCTGEVMNRPQKAVRKSERLTKHKHAEPPAKRKPQT